MILYYVRSTFYVLTCLILCWYSKQEGMGAFVAAAASRLARGGATSCRRRRPGPVVLFMLAGDGAVAIRGGGSGSVVSGTAPAAPISAPKAW